MLDATIGCRMQDCPILQRSWPIEDQNVQKIDDPFPSHPEQHSQSSKERQNVYVKSLSATDAHLNCCERINADIFGGPVRQMNLDDLCCHFLRRLNSIETVSTNEINKQFDEITGGTASGADFFAHSLEPVLNYFSLFGMQQETGLVIYTCIHAATRHLINQPRFKKNNCA